jgi:hypothetical protein
VAVAVVDALGTMQASAPVDDGILIEARVWAGTFNVALIVQCADGRYYGALRALSREAHLWIVDFLRRNTGRRLRSVLEEADVSNAWLLNLISVSIGSTQCDTEIPVFPKSPDLRSLAAHNPWGSMIEAIVISLLGTVIGYGVWAQWKMNRAQNKINEIVFETIKSHAEMIKNHTGALNKAETKNSTTSQSLPVKNGSILGAILVSDRAFSVIYPLL